MPSIDYVFSTEANPDAPVAIIAPASQDTVVGAIARLDGRSSISRSGNPLTYTWAFVQSPIGSQVASIGFKGLEPDNSVVSFAPDVTGIYVVSLIVNDGSFDSAPAESTVNTKVILVPQNLGIVPDASWIWNLLSDFWTRVEQKNKFETIWSSAIQIIAAEQLKLWQYDYNKSIRDIQELIQRRWLKYEPALALDPTMTSFILADDQAGLNASTFLIDPLTNGLQANQPQLSNLVTVPVTEGSFSKTAYGAPIALGRLLALDEMSFTLGRTGAATRSVDQANDGATVSSTNAFLGSAFSTGMLGMTLKILSGAFAGLYTIIGVASSSTLQVQNPDGSAVSFASGSTGISYSIFPALGSYSSFFADRNLVPTRLSPLPWRFSSTLVSTQYDFGNQGVSPGDVLVAQITRTDNQRASNLNVQVVSVDRGRLGVVFNTLDLVAGVASTGLSDADKIQLANDLQVPGLMQSLADGSLVYTDQALAIQTLLASPAFKRQFFEQTLTYTSSINIGPFSITITPIQVIRNSKILIDSTIKSIPSLQEYVRQPDIVEQNGSLFQIANGTLYPVARQPYIVTENTDYILDDESAITGTCTVVAGDDHVIVPFGDLIDRSIGQGDFITIQNGVTETKLQIISIADAQTLRVSPAPTFTNAATSFTITRAITGTFIRFIDGVFSKKVPAPARFWAEVTFFDNNDSVENNFGVLVGVLRSDLSSVGATISYRNAVAGLMYALTNGPTLANLQLASQILLGLPFTTYPGTIIEIDQAFKVNPDGSPAVGRILVAAEDAQGNPIGITNIYFFPQGKQIPDPANPGKFIPVNPDLSGIAINPNTGNPYVVGDKVAIFAALSKGTQIQDYLTTASFAQQALAQGNSAFAIQQYHAFQLTVNADITTAIDTDLVAQFIRKTKPTYVKLYLALSEALEDNVIVTDGIIFGSTVRLTDNESLSMPVSTALDPQSVDAAYVTTEGEMWSYRLFGSDLATTQSSLQVSSASGGFITPRTLESHDGSFIVSGHLVSILSGPNAGNYLVNTVDSDTQITLQSLDEEGAPFVFETASGQSFVIYMPVFPRIIRGLVTVTNGATSFVPPFGIGSPGLAVGDLMVYFDPSGSVLSGIHRVIGVDPSTGTVTFTPSVPEATGSRMVEFFREGLLRKHLIYGATDTPFAVVQTSTSNALVLAPATTDYAVPLLAFPGDTVVNPSTAEEFDVIDFDPTTGTFYVQPAAANSGTFAVALKRPSRAADVTISSDILDRMPGGSLFLTMRRRSVGAGGAGPDLTTTASSPTVTTVSGIDFNTGLGVVVGDYLVVLEGADSARDIGYGAGIFPILAVSGTSLVLTRPLTVTNNSPGILYGIQRRRPNER